MDVITHASLTAHGRELVQQVTADRRCEIARIADKMPSREPRGLVGALTAFTAAGDDPPTHVDADV